MRSEKEIRTYLRNAQEIADFTQRELDKLNPLEKIVLGMPLADRLRVGKICIAALRWALGEVGQDDSSAESAAKMAALIRSGKGMKEIIKEMQS